MRGENFRILRSLNTAGTVTLAENRENGRRFVLKELPEESLPVYRRISELPPQENLMQVHEILRQEGRITALCEFAEGRSLNELLDSGRVFPAADILRIISQLCRAVEHLHSFEIIHRDITTRNIILDENLNLKLIDFDIARLYSGNREQDTTLYGTEGFAPPEQYGFRETRFTADVYAIGMVLKLLLNSCPDCPPAQEVALRKVAAKCSRFVPEKRFRSAAAVRRAASRSRFVFPLGILAVSAALVIVAAVLVFRNVGGELPRESGVTLLPESGSEISASAELPPADTKAVTAAATAETTKATGVSLPPTTEQPVTSAAATTAPAAPSITEPAATLATTSAATLPVTPTTTLPVTTASTPRATTATKPVSTPETASAQTTAATTAPISEPAESLHTSDMDNPNKITVTTSKNEQGYFEDAFVYEFFDDPAVHGEWSYCNTIPKSALTPLISASDIEDFNFGSGHIFSALSLGDNGETRCILANGEEMPCNSRWTNGFLICEYVEGTAAQEMFELTIDGEEFLFVAVKGGDFLLGNRVEFFEIFTRTTAR